MTTRLAHPSAHDRARPADEVQSWTLPIEAVLDAVGSSLGGLSDVEAAERRSRDDDPLGEHRRRPALRLLASQFTSPIVLVLVAATIVSMVLGDPIDGSIIITIILASGFLGFWQEFRADAAVAQLLASVQVITRVAVSLGGNVKLVQLMLGHASAAHTLDIYADLFPDDLETLAEAFDRAIADAEVVSSLSRFSS